MAYEDGDDFVDGAILSYQQGNRMKNNWRQSDPKTNVSNAQPGMILSDEDDEKLHHVTGDTAGFDEILQENNSFDTTPVFSALRLDVDSSAVSDPPTDAELDALYTSPATVGAGWHKFLLNISSGGSMYLIMSDGANWYTVAFTLAV